MTGKSIEACWLEKEDGTLRHMAASVAADTARYTYFTANASTDAIAEVGARSIRTVLNDGTWDFVVIQQQQPRAGVPGTLHEDIAYMADLVRDLQPSATLLWGMTWASSAANTMIVPAIRSNTAAYCSCFFFLAFFVCFML